LRLHHAVADGAAALAVFGARLDPAPSAPAPVAPLWTPAPVPFARQLLADNLRRRRAELGRGWSGLAHPGTTVRQARQGWPAWQEVLTDHPAPHTSLNQPVGAAMSPGGVRADILGVQDKSAGSPAVSESGMNPRAKCPGLPYAPDRQSLGRGRSRAMAADVA
jgi:Wax ester synthase/diacylglycerol acyltransferase catalytic domain